MTAPIPPLRKAAMENARRVHTGTTVPPELTSHRKYRLDDFAEWALSGDGKENIALVVLAAASIGLIYLLHHHG